MVEKLKPAFKGFLVWSIPSILCVAAIYLLGSYYLVETQSGELVRAFGYTASEAAEVIQEDARWVARNGVLQLLFLFSTYWLCAALFDVRNSLAARTANTLLFAGTAGILFLFVNRFFYWIDGYCDQLPFPHQGFQLLRVYECPSSATFLSLTWGLSVSLFLVSLVFRARHCRRNRSLAVTR